GYTDPINKSQRGTRKSKRRDDHHLVDVCSKDAGMSNLLYRCAQDVIVARKDIRNHTIAFVKLYAIANGHWVCLLDPFKTDFSPDATLVVLPVLTPDVIPGSRRSHHNSLHSPFSMVSKYCTMVFVAPKFSRT